MAEPELGPSRICSEAQAFVSAELGRIVCLELQFVILKKIKKLYLKKCFQATVPWYPFICSNLYVRGGGGRGCIYSLFFRISISRQVVLNTVCTLKSLEELKKKKKKINVQASLPRDSHLIGEGWYLKICIFKVPLVILMQNQCTEQLL